MLRRNLLHPRDQCGAHLSGRTANHIRSCPTASRIQIEQISFSIRRPFEKMTVLDPRPTPAVQQLVSDTFHYAASERRFFYVHRRASPAMKERATVLCQRGDRILLVARPRARWVLPGGKPRSSETLSDAARRELTEETGIVCRAVRPLFQFAGGNKQHHVFVADIEASAIARPAQEIARCAWFDRQAIASIDCSRPTPFIVRRALKVLDDERYVMAYMEAMLLQAAA